VQLVDLFANIGGLMGLFMGMSVLSLIEFAELAIELLLLAWEEWRSARRVQTTDTVFISANSKNARASYGNKQ